MIAPWAMLHKSMYMQLIKLRSTHGLSTSSLKTASDKWMVFYTKLMLRYGRPYRHFMKKKFSANEWLDNKKMWDMTSKIGELKQTLFYSSYQNKIQRLVDSCKITKGSVVQFQRTIYRTQHCSTGPNYLYGCYRTLMSAPKW